MDLQKDMQDGIAAPVQDIGSALEQLKTQLTDINTQLETLQQYCNGI